MAKTDTAQKIAASLRAKNLTSPKRAGSGVRDAGVDLHSAAGQYLLVAVKAEMVRQRKIRTARISNRPSVRCVEERETGHALHMWNAFGREQYMADRAGRVRRAIQSELRKAGYRRRHTSGDGSNYYERWNNETGDWDAIRISDHDVPMTKEREWNSENGGFTWADRDYIDVYEFSTPADARAAVVAMLA